MQNIQNPDSGFHVAYRNGRPIVFHKAIFVRFSVFLWPNVSYNFCLLLLLTQIIYIACFGLCKPLPFYIYLKWLTLSIIFVFLAFNSIPYCLQVVRAGGRSQGGQLPLNFGLGALTNPFTEKCE